MNQCPTTSDSPVTVIIQDSNVGAYSFGSFTQYVSADTWVLLQVFNQVSGNKQARLRIAYTGSNLKFYTATSSSNTLNSRLLTFSTSGEKTISSG